MKIVWTLILTGMTLLCGSPAWTLQEDAREISTRFGAFQAFADSSGIVYGDVRGFLRVLKRKGGGYEAVWKSESATIARTARAPVSAELVTRAAAKCVSALCQSRIVAATRPR